MQKTSPRWQRRTPRGVLLGAGLALLMAASTGAERTRFWRQSSYQEFERGTPKGVALRSDGKLILAPKFAEFADPNAAYLWALRADSRGRLYVAGGSTAKVVRLDDKGAATKVFESEELAAQALVMDAKDNLYVGTSPDGKVYKVTPQGEKTVFFEPKTKYIWDLALDATGTLFVATGDKGEIFAVGPDGKGRLYFKSEETHIRALAIDAKGSLIFGSEPNGLVVRVEASAAAQSKTAGGGAPAQPRGFVLHEATKKEVTALLFDRSGNLYAAAVGEKPRTQRLGPDPAQQAAVTAAAAAAAAAAAQGQQPLPQQPVQTVPPFLFPTTGGSAVYRIAADGAPEEIWTSRDELVYSLGLSPSGKLLLGTGNRGRVMQLEAGERFSALAQSSAAQVTGMARAADGKIYLCTANPGKVFALGPGYEQEGTFESEPFDARVFSQWGRLTWWGDNGATNGHLSFYVRTGNTSNPGENWGPWAGPYSNAKGEAKDLPPARFAQWKAVFKAPGAADNGDSPTISWVSLAYLPKNVAPQIDQVILQKAGVRIQGFTPPSGGGGQQNVQLSLPQGQRRGGPTLGTQQQQQGPGPRFDPPPQGFVQRGFQGVVWSAQDDNDDDLVFSIFYRGEGEKNWKLLKDNLEQKYYSWDAGTMPDGAYYLRIVVSDAPSNPRSDALTAERESERFEVDNTPPQVLTLNAETMSPDARVRFEARDSYSTIARAEYSVDAGEWRLVFPLKRITDSPQENYELKLEGLAPGEHTVAVRVFDQFENSTSAKVTFTVEAKKR